jgi:hypothetical protein
MAEQVHFDETMGSRADLMAIMHNRIKEASAEVKRLEAKQGVLRSEEGIQAAKDHLKQIQLQQESSLNEDRNVRVGKSSKTETIH